MAAEIHSVIQTASVCSNLGLNCSMMTRYKNRKLEESSVSMVLLNRCREEVKVLD